MYFILAEKTLILYFLIVICYRVMGKKEVGELNIVDLIVTILIAELAAICIEETEKSIFTSIVPILTLVLIQIALSQISLKSNSIRNILDGKPTVIIKNGKIVFSQMTKIRYTLDDLLSQLREKGVKSIEEVDYAILENSGELSVFQNTKDFPMPIIIDGVLKEDVLREIGKTKNQVIALLDKKNILLDDVFYAFYKNKKLYIIKRNDLI